MQSPPILDVFTVGSGLLVLPKINGPLPRPATAGLGHHSHFETKWFQFFLVGGIPVAPDPLQGLLGVTQKPMYLPSISRV